MKESLYDYFNKRSTFVKATVIAVLFFIANIVIKFLISFGDASLFTENAAIYPSEMFKLAFSDIILVACLIGFSNAFLKHNKNVQKMLLGAMLIWYVLDQTLYLFSQIVLGQFSATIDVFMVVLDIIFLVMFVLLLINSLVINSDKSDKPGHIYFNQVIIIILILLAIIKAVYLLCAYDGVSLLPLLEGITWQIGYIFFLIVVMSYETEIDNFRKIRKSK